MNIEIVVKNNPKYKIIIFRCDNGEFGFQLVRDTLIDRMFNFGGYKYIDTKFVELSGCFKDSDNWETVKLYQVGTEWLFDCSSGCYRLDNPLQFDHNKDKILEVLISGNTISGIKDN